MPSGQSYTTALHASLHETVEIFPNEEVRSLGAHPPRLQLAAHDQRSDRGTAAKPQIDCRFLCREVG